MVGASLIGREGEFGVLAQRIRGVAGGQGGAVLVEGEPGIGKSALLQAARGEMAAAGCAVYWGTAEELGELFPLQPLLAAFSRKPAHSDSADSAAAAEALLAHIDQLCARSPVVLVVDDLHWADAATVAVCYRLVRSAAQRPLLLLGALRSLPRRADLASLRRVVGRASYLRLQPLPPDAATELVACLAGGVPGPGLAKVAADAVGNPLYLTEIVDVLRRSGGLTVDAGVVDLADAAAAAPATLPEAIREGLDFLPAPTRSILQVAALLGTEFGVADLAAVLGRPVPELVSALRDALAADVLAESGERLAFRHPLIRAALYDEMSAPVRTAWHFEAAAALRQAGAAASAVARQLLPAMAAPPDEVHVGPWVTDWLLAAAPTLAGEAPTAAGTLLKAATTRLPSGDRRRHVLAVHLARALVYQAAYEEVETIIAATLPNVRDPDVLVDLYDALVTASQGSRERFEETLAELDRAATAFPGLPDTARLRLNVLAARVEMANGDLSRLEARARGTLDTAVALRDRWSIGWMCNVLACSRWLDGDVREPLDLLDQGLAATADDPQLLDPHLLMLGNRGNIEGDLDLFEQARATMTRARRLAEETGKLGRAVQVQRSLVQLYFDHGQWDDALAEAELPDNVDASNLHQALSITAVILFHRADSAGAGASLVAARRLGRRLQDQGQWAFTEALACEVAGERRAALDVLAAGVADAEGLLDIEQWLADAVRLATDLGDTATAAAATAQAETLAAGDRQLPRRVAIAAHCQGTRRADPHLLLHAAEGYAEIGRPLPRAQALEAAAGLLADRGDIAAARLPFQAALEAYSGLGAEWDLARMRARFRKHRLKAPARLASRPTSGWEALTATEAEVAELVAQGKSNPEIAAELAVSRRTVETHVTHILAKLQLRSRIDIARTATSRT